MYGKIRGTIRGSGLLVTRLNRQDCTRLLVDSKGRPLAFLESWEDAPEGREVVEFQAGLK